MAHNAINLLDHISGNAPHNIFETQRVTVLKKDITHLNQKVNQFLGNTDSQAISLTEIANKLDYAKLNLQPITNDSFKNADPALDKSNQLSILLTPDTVDLNTFKHKISIDKDFINAIGINTVDLELTINTAEGFVTKAKDVIIDSNTTFNEETGVFEVNLVDEGQSFGAQTANVTVALDKPRTIHINADPNVSREIIPMLSNIGMSKIKLLPTTIPSFKVKPSDLTTSTQIIKASDTDFALGFETVEIPPCTPNKDDVEVLLPANKDLESTNDLITVNSAVASSQLTITMEYPINILGEYTGMGVPAVVDAISYIDKDGNIKTCQPNIGDVVYNYTDFGDSTAKKQIIYYIYNGIWKQHNINQPFFVTKSRDVGTITKTVETGELKLVADEDAFGFMEATITTPGAIDYTFNVPTALIQSVNENINDTTDTKLVFNCSDEKYKVNTLTIPKIKACSVTVTEQEIVDAVKRKRETLPIRIEQSTFDNPVLMEAVTIYLPTSFEETKLKRDLAVCETKINTNSTLADLDQINLDFSIKNTIILDSNESEATTSGVSKTIKKSYIYDRTDINTLQLAVQTPRDCTISIYQLSNPTSTTRTTSSKFNDKIKLFEFTAQGTSLAYNETTNTYQTIEAPHYTIEIKDNFKYIPELDGETEDINILNTVFEGVNVKVTTADLTKILTKAEMLELFNTIEVADRPETCYYIVECVTTVEEKPLPQITYKTETYNHKVDNDTSLTIDIIDNKQQLTELIYKQQTYQLTKQEEPTIEGSYYYLDAEGNINYLELIDSLIYLNGQFLHRYVTYKQQNSLKMLCFNDFGIIANELEINTPKFSNSFGIALTNDGVSQLLVNGVVYNPIKINYTGQYLAKDDLNNEFSVNITKNLISFNPPYLKTEENNN